MMTIVKLFALPLLLLIYTGCASDGSTVNTKEKAVMGAAAGAIIGGVIGHQSGRGLEGAAVGAAAGGAGGAVMGSAQDEKSAAQNQR
ncbi:MAG: glycine zipper domain-containing protein [Kiritimatiellia bacterium]